MLVTGGAGFIGSHLCELLLEHGHEVTALDDLSVGIRDNLAEVLDWTGFRLVQASVLDTDTVEVLLRSCEVVFHLAGVAGVPAVLADPVGTFQVNLGGTGVIGEAAARLGTTVVYASGAEVYGPRADVPQREGAGCHIDHQRNGWSSFGVSTAASEEYLQLLTEHSRFPLVIARLFNVAGARQSVASGAVLPRMVTQALRSEPITVFGTGDQSRTFAHVRDVGRGLETLAAMASAEPAVLNLGATAEISMLDLALRVAEVIGSTSRPELVDYVTAYGSGYVDQHRRRPDITEVRSLIGWQAETPLETIIQDVASSIARR